MANRKKEVHKVKPMTEGKRNIIQGLLQLSLMKPRAKVTTIPNVEQYQSKNVEICQNFTNDFG